MAAAPLPTLPFIFLLWLHQVFSNRALLLLRSPVLFRQSAEPRLGAGADPSGSGEPRSARRGRSELGYFRPAPRRPYCLACVNTLLIWASPSCLQKATAPADVNPPSSPSLSSPSLQFVWLPLSVAGRTALPGLCGSRAAVGGQGVFPCCALPCPSVRSCAAPSAFAASRSVILAERQASRNG